MTIQEQIEKAGSRLETFSPRLSWRYFAPAEYDIAAETSAQALVQDLRIAMALVQAAPADSAIYEMALRRIAVRAIGCVETLELRLSDARA